MAQGFQKRWFYTITLMDMIGSLRGLNAVANAWQYDSRFKVGQTDYRIFRVLHPMRISPFWKKGG
jgi:hypothetical protein